MDIVREITVQEKYRDIQYIDGKKAVRRYEGVDMREVYRNKPILYKFIKRTFDIIISALGLVILSPIFLITAIAIKIEDGGPVFFSAYRYGKDLKYFPMHKFRSMIPDAEARLKEFLKEEDKNGLAYKIENDPRITKVGEFIRKTSIDELPQLWNVLKGEMSLVGPRPINIIDKREEVYEMQRWAVKPGITCIWQVCGRAEVPWDEWVEMDLEYIDRMSIRLDIKLLGQTFSAVIGRKGAM